MIVGLLGRGSGQLYQLMLPHFFGDFSVSFVTVSWFDSRSSALLSHPYSLPQPSLRLRPLRLLHSTLPWTLSSFLRAYHRSSPPCQSMVYPLRIAEFTFLPIYHDAVIVLPGSRPHCCYFSSESYKLEGIPQQFTTLRIFSELRMYYVA
jgi:hypothetical protein